MLAQIYEDGLDNFAPKNESEQFAMNSGFWFEMCVNI
jgi:hypothetical protein